MDRLCKLIFELLANKNRYFEKQGCENFNTFLQPCFICRINL